MEPIEDTPDGNKLNSSLKVLASVGVVALGVDGDVVSKDVDAHLHKREKKGNEGVDEDNKEKRGEDTSLRDATTDGGGSRTIV